MNQTEFEQAIRDELEQAEQNIDELILDISSMTVAECLAIRDRVIHSSVRWYVHLDAPRRIKDQRSSLFFGNLLERVDSHLSMKMELGYEKTLECEAPL